MSKKWMYAFLGILAMAGCNKFDLDYTAAMQNQDAEKIQENATQILGQIDPNQDWNSIKSNVVTIQADADLKDIVKVQILTESPYFNPDARVLNEQEVSKGQTVSLVYDAPNTYTQLIAACIDSKGVYYIMPFNIGDHSVSFSTLASGKRAARRAAAGFPDLNSLVLKADRSCLSYNAMRTIKANEGETTNHIDIWKGKGWENERLYAVDDSKEKELMQDVGPIDETEKAVLTSIFDNYLGRNKVGYKKQDNMDAIRNSGIFSLEHNHLTSDGETPIVLTPVQMASSEIGFCHLYYYYYDPAQIQGMSDAEQVQFLKDLPKYKVIQCYRTDASVWHATWTAQGDRYAENEFFKKHAYTMVYWGDGQPEFGQKAVSYTFPKGYKIGFMLRKLKTESGDCYGNYAKKSYEYVQNGEVYGDGRLNTEINTFPGHFSNSTAKESEGQGSYSMQPDDPRVALFGANNKTYLTFEDGEDCQFSDMIIEVSGGTQYIDEPQEVEAAAYTMCFEDRPMQADYDLNDVVLRCIRRNSTKLQLSLVACGGNDDVVIHGATGWMYNDMEVHKVFEAEEPDSRGNRFVNTEVGGVHLDPMAAFVTVSEGTTIPQYLKGIFIENKTTGKIIQIPKKGEAPFAIIVPLEFDYPMESQPITKAYEEFINWAQDVNTSGNWYLFETSDKIFPSLYKKW